MIAAGQLDKRGKPLSADAAVQLAGITGGAVAAVGAPAAATAPVVAAPAEEVVAEADAEDAAEKKKAKKGESWS